MLYLASDEARYLTGVAMPADAGFLLNLRRRFRVLNAQFDDVE